MRKLDRIENCFNILRNYNGNNPYFLMLKRDLYITKTIKELSDFQIEYIEKNINYIPKSINKIIKISDWYGENRKQAWNTEFIPEKLQVISLLGETDKTYHCIVKYRQSVPPVQCFIPKKAVITNFLYEDYHKLEVDFDRYDKLSTAKDPNRKLMEHQKDGIKFLLSRKKCILADDMGLGKMEPVTSLIPTPNGYKQMGDICIGDKIFGSDGKVYKVLNIFPHKNKEIYKVTFSDHTTMECGLEHLWMVRDCNMRIRKQGWKTISLKDMLSMGLQYNNNPHRNKFEIPVTNPVEYSHKEYFIDPYVMGMCIGDGNMCNGGIKISIPYFEHESVDRINSLLNENYELHGNYSDSCPRYCIVLKTPGKKNEYNREIKRLGLNVKGNFKFIPDIYKFGSIEQRLKLLQGLMDSDGTIAKNNKILYSTTSKQLAEDVAELVFSLGGTSRIHAYNREKVGKNTEYTVSMQIKLNPFLLGRKRDKYKPTYKKYFHKYIVSAEYVRNEDAQCIMVDSPDNTYLTGKNYIVTHNTSTLSVAAIEGNFDSILIICPASIKNNWKKELLWYVPEKDISVIDGFNDKNKSDLETFLGYGVGKSNKTKEELLNEAKTNGKWQFNRFVIVNYDILDEFCSTSGRKVETDSPLLNYIKDRKSLIIIDEAHNLSNPTSNRYKVIKKLINIGKPHSVYLSTGTPVTNNPLNLFYLLELIENEITSDYKYYIDTYCDSKKFPAKGEREKWTNIYLKKIKKSSWYNLTSAEKDDLKEFIKNNAKMITTANGATNLDELKEKVSHIYLRRVKEDLNSLPQKYLHELHYDLTEEQKKEYERLWDEFEFERMEANSGLTTELNRDLLEGAVYRNYLSLQTIPYTTSLADKLINEGKKVVIMCCFDEELYTLRDYYKDKCVIFNGKCSLKQKDAAVEKFMTDDSCMVFIGNIIAASVGITLTSSYNLIFNDFDYVPANFRQACDRIHRKSQTKDCHIYVQLFNNTHNEHVWDTIMRKQAISDSIIVKENEK